MLEYIEIKDFTDGGAAVETDLLAAQRGATGRSLSIKQIRQHVTLKDYDANLQYLAGSSCFYVGIFFRANKTTQGIFKPDDWDEVRSARMGGGVVYKVKAGTRVIVSSGHVMQWSADLPLEIEAGGILEIEPDGYVFPPAGSNILNNGTIINNGTINTQGGGMVGGAGDYGGLGDFF